MSQSDAVGPDVCAECGQRHVRKNGQITCTAHLKRVRPKQPCLRLPKAGHDACRVHGGDTKTSRKKAEKRIAEKYVKENLGTFGQPVPHNLAEGVLEEIFWLKGSLMFLREIIGELDPDALTWGLSEYSDKTGGEDWGSKTTEKASINVWVKLLQEQQKLYIEFVSKAHTMGIEERRIKLAEQYGQHILNGLKVMADQLRTGMVKQGWDAEELEEAWDEILREAIPTTIKQMRELAP